VPAPEPAPPSPLARHDLWAGAAFALLGALVAFESWRMPRLEERGIDPWTAPGIVPGVLGITLTVLGVVLGLRGLNDIRQAAMSGQRVIPAAIMGQGESRTRFLIALALNLGYALLLVGRVPFWMATLAYLLAFMTVFGLGMGTPGAGRRAAINALVAAAATAAIVYLFQTLFLVRLP
jgi:putative tricarboxylic transport membrane protein